MDGTSTDVAAALASARRRRREPGEVVYPVAFTRAMADLCVCVARVGRGRGR
jgi:hypothetical protein